MGKGMRRRTSAIFLFCLSVEFFQRNAVVILIEFYQFHGRFAAWTLQGIVTEGAGDQGAPFIHREQESMFLSADGATEGAVFLPVSGIESIVTDHLEVFFRDMPDQPLNKFESGNGFLNISFIFMAVIVKSNQIAIITVNAGGSDDRAAEIAANVFENITRFALSGFGKHIEAIFVIEEDRGFDFLEGITKAGMKFIQESRLEGIA